LASRSRPPPALRGRELRRQLVAAPLAELLVLLSVDAPGLLEDLARDLLVVARRVLRGVRVHLRAVEREHPDMHQPGLGAERQHATEQPPERRLVTLAKARDRRVVRGPRLAQITRVATSSTQRRSIRPDERSPIA
jgi:hypothetical protein